jgi:hypothetical protein
MLRCSTRSSFVGLGRARRPRYSTPKSASGAAGAERGDAPWSLARRTGAAPRVSAHRALGGKSGTSAAKHLRRGLAQAISQQPRTMRRRPPRSLPRSPATEAPSRSNTLVNPADDQRHAFQAVAPPTSDRLTNKCPPTGCCEPPAPPVIWCVLIPVNAIARPHVPASPVSKKCP